jgi:hypothetical protein
LRVFERIGKRVEEGALALFGLNAARGMVAGGPSLSVVAGRQRGQRYVGLACLLPGRGNGSLRRGAPLGGRGKRTEGIDRQSGVQQVARQLDIPGGRFMKQGCPELRAGLEEIGSKRDERRAASGFSPN